MIEAQVFQKREKLKIALVHYFLVNRRGGERVLYTLAELFPQVDIYALVVDKKIQPHWVLSRLKVTSFVYHLPFLISHFKIRRFVTVGTYRVDWNVYTTVEKTQA